MAAPAGSAAAASAAATMATATIASWRRAVVPAAARRATGWLDPMTSDSPSVRSYEWSEGAAAGGAADSGTRESRGTARRSPGRGPRATASASSSCTRCRLRAKERSGRWPDCWCRCPVWDGWVSPSSKYVLLREPGPPRSMSKYGSPKAGLLAKNFTFLLASLGYPMDPLTELPFGLSSLNRMAVPPSSNLEAAPQFAVQSMKSTLAPVALTTLSWTGRRPRPASFFATVGVDFVVAAVSCESEPHADIPDRQRCHAGQRSRGAGDGRAGDFRGWGHEGCP